MDLAFVLITLRRAWWLLLVTASLGVGGAAVVNVTSPVEYTADVQQFVSMTGEVGTGNAAGGALSGSQFTLQRVKSYTQIANSSRVLGPVIDQLHLPTTVGQLAGRVQATNPLDTVLILLSVTDTNPQRAADTANAISVQLGKVVQDTEAPAGGGVSPVKVTVTQPATAPTTPVSPKVKLNLALGLLVGLGLGAGGALLRGQLDTRIAQAGDVENITGRGPIGVVPFDSTAKTQPLISTGQSTARSEAFRTLRTNLRFIDVDNPPKTIVITSPLAGEGKSSSACNIALTLAHNGSRVVLVEADLRKPQAAAYLGLESAVGLTNVLVGQHPLPDVLVNYQGGLLTVLPAGPVPPNPSELLGSQHLAALLHALADRFDYVIIDAAPLLPVTDAAVLSSAADGALVIVRHSKTTRDELQRALQALEAANARILGTVVNFAPPHKRKGRGYGYGYGTYGGYIGSTPTQNLTGAAGFAAPAPAVSAALGSPYAGLNNDQATSHDRRSSGPWEQTSQPAAQPGPAVSAHPQDDAATLLGAGTLPPIVAPDPAADRPARSGGKQPRRGR